VQTVTEKKYVLEDVVSQQGLHISQFMGEDVQNISEARFERIIASRDTDVLVLVIHFAAQLIRGLWMRTETEKQRSFIAVKRHTITSNTSKEHPSISCINRM